MKKVLGGALGECVHVAGTTNFLRLARENGWETVNLGPAVSVERWIDQIRREDPDLVAVSYRLTPRNGEAVLRKFITSLEREGLADRSYVFGGTPPVVEKAKKLEFFERTFSGEEPIDDIVRFLRGQTGVDTVTSTAPGTFSERVNWKAPYPLLRHHFGQPDVEETAIGITQIADAQVLDVVSLGTDQDAQELFYHPENQDPSRAGAGGVAVRSEEDLIRLYEASRTGNFPLMRIYAGTDDHLQLAEMYLRTIHNAWCASPLFWFNQLDSRGPMGLEQSIAIHQDLMRWHAERDVPVEANEPHHWGMRDSSDVVYVVASYLSAYNAKAAGVGEYIAQYMFDCPPGTSGKMDLAKMLACIRLSESLQRPGFRMYRQTRTGLLSYPVDPDMALGQLGASVYLQMALQPHVVHVVSPCEAVQAASAEDIIRSTKLTQWVIKTAVEGAPDMTNDREVQERTDQLVSDARLTLDAIRRIAEPEIDDPWTDPGVLAEAVKIGILDAPQLEGSTEAKGSICTALIDGASVTVDPDTGDEISEQSRLEYLLERVV